MQGRVAPPPLRLVYAGVAVVAFGLRLSMSLRGGGLRGLFGYDDGVYFSAAESLTWGHLPYRDFVLLHPPGILLALTPFALLGRLGHDVLGFESARLAWMVVGAANAVLVSHVVRRSGVVAAATAGLFYALWPIAALTEATTRLEPLVTLGLLVGVALLTRPACERSRRARLLVGAALGFAVAVKIWALAPAVVVVLWCVRRHGVRAGAAVAAGAAAMVATLCVAFFVAAPGAMLRMVVLDQLGRARMPVSTWERMSAIVGVVPPGPGAVVGVVLLALAVALGWLGGRPEARLWIGLLAVQVVVLLLSPSFFYYYPAFAAPGLALVVGGATEVLLARSWVRESRAAVVVVLLLATLVAVGSTRTAGRHFPTRALQTLVTGTRCVTADSPDVLVLTNVLGRDLRRHCPVMVDVTGLTYDRDVRYRHGHPVARRHDHAWQRDLRTYLTSGGVAFIVRAQQDGLSGRSRRVLGRLPSLHAARDYVLQRVGPWGTRAGPGHATDGRTSFRAMSIRRFRRSTLTGP